jgi:hypothetical protein
MVGWLGASRGSVGSLVLSACGTGWWLVPVRNIAIGFLQCETVQYEVPHGLFSGLSDALNGGWLMAVIGSRLRIAVPRLVCSWSPPSAALLGSPWLCPTDLLKILTRVFQSPLEAPNPA